MGSTFEKTGESTVALNETGERRTEGERERERKTRGPRSWLLYCHEAPATLPDYEKVKGVG